MESNQVLSNQVLNGELNSKQLGSYRCLIDAKDKRRHTFYARKLTGDVYGLAGCDIQRRPEAVETVLAAYDRCVAGEATEPGEIEKHLQILIGLGMNRSEVEELCSRFFWPIAIEGLVGLQGLLEHLAETEAGGQSLVPPAPISLNGMNKKEIQELTP